MKISDVVAALEKIQREHGDVEVLVTDGFDARCYRGEYEIRAWDEDGVMCADIGIGGCGQ